MTEEQYRKIFETTEALNGQEAYNFIVAEFPQGGKHRKVGTMIHDGCGDLVCLYDHDGKNVYIINSIEFDFMSVFGVANFLDEALTLLQLHEHLKSKVASANDQQTYILAKILDRAYGTYRKFMETDESEKNSQKQTLYEKLKNSGFSEPEQLLESNIHILERTMSVFDVARLLSEMEV